MTGKIATDVLQSSGQVDNIGLGASGPSFLLPVQSPLSLGVTSLSDANQVLTSTSLPLQAMGPTATRTVKLDNSFTKGQVVEIFNTGTTPGFGISVTANDNSAIATVYQGSSLRFLCISAGPTTNTSWYFLDGVSIGQLPGTKTNDNALIGNVGEIQTISRSQSTATALSSAGTTNIGIVVSISLTPGQWQISGAVVFLAAASTTVTQLRAAVSLTSASVPANDTSADPAGGEFTIVQNYPAGYVPGADVTLQIPSYQVQLTTTSVFYLVGRPVFGTSTMTGYGYLQATRVR